MKFFGKMFNRDETQGTFALSKEGSWALACLMAHFQKEVCGVTQMAVVARTAFLTAQEKFEYVYVEKGGTLKLIDVMTPGNNGLLPSIASEAQALVIQVAIPKNILIRLKQAHCSDTKFSLDKYIDESLILLCQLSLCHVQGQKVFLAGSSSESKKEVNIFLR